MAALTILQQVSAGGGLKAHSELGSLAKPRVHRRIFSPFLQSSAAWCCHARCSVPHLVLRLASHEWYLCCGVPSSVRHSWHTGEAVHPRAWRTDWVTAALVTRALATPWSILVVPLFRSQFWMGRIKGAGAKLLYRGSLVHLSHCCFAMSLLYIALTSSGQVTSASITRFSLVRKVLGAGQFQPASRMAMATAPAGPLTSADEGLSLHCACFRQALAWSSVCLPSQALRAH